MDKFTNNILHEVSDVFILIKNCIRNVELPFVKPEPIEPRYEKTGVLHDMRKQRRRSAVQ